MTGSSTASARQETVLACKSIHVPVDADRTWEELVKAGNYGVYRAWGFDPHKHLPPLPADIQNTATTFADILPPRTEGVPPKPKGLKPEQWLTGGTKFVHPLILLAIGERYPDEQVQCPIFVFWRDREKQIWIAMLSASFGDRSLVVTTIQPNSLAGDGEIFEWGATSRAAVQSGA